MKRADIMLPLRSAFRRLLLVLACTATLAAQTKANPPAPAPSTAAIATVGTIDGPWRFAAGDDPRWADPGFDDSAWSTVNLAQPLENQGVEPYTGYGWYRVHLQPQDFAALAAGERPMLLVTGNSVGQLAVYVNGLESGHTEGMKDPPAMYLSPPFTASFLGLSTKQPVVIAIRTWVGPGVMVHRGLLTRVDVGAPTEIQERLAASVSNQWGEYAITPIAIAFLFVCVALLGLALFLAQRHHREYLWLALLCVSVAISAAGESAYGLAIIPYNVFSIFSAFSGRVFMAVTLEFVLTFTGGYGRKTVRGVQIALLLLPFASLAHLTQIYQIVAAGAEIVFCALVCVLLFRAWRRGQTDAGVMFLPFLLAATADSADTLLSYAAGNHWLPDRFLSMHFHLGPIAFGTGTIAYSVFLASIVAVILYRFIRVSQEEQRTTAEIAAARSVQSLLIPTQLPSNHNFMLESAYLPFEGVGGDFFQVLPLKDESLLIVVGDVSGKGLQAAMNSSTLVGALRNETSNDPATILNHLNRVLLGAVSSPGAVPELDAAPCFATCLCARIYPDGKLIVANAGHLGPYRDGHELELIPGLPLGVIADASYEQSTFQLAHGDRLVFLSDGVVEAINGDGELFGFDRTRQVSNESARYIAQTAKHFGQTDDITVLSLYVASRAAKAKSEELARID
jgi:hypothetical protein